MSAALARFWWLVVLGVFAGMAVAASMVYDLPSLTLRDQPLYTANARLFVTSSQGQYVRISVPRTVESQDTTQDRPSGGRPLVINEAPNVQPLLSAATVYPQIIESDEVARVREDIFGSLPGEVVANAFSSVSTRTRFSPAQIPVIDIFATADSAKEAITLAGATSDAFQRWLRREQDRAGVEPEERIIIRPLRAPVEALPLGGPSYGIPILAALAVAAAFGMIAVVLDQLFPRTATAPHLQSDTN